MINSNTPFLNPDSNLVSHAWFKFFSGLVGTPNQETAVTVTTSPFIYTAPIAGTLFVKGGTVSSISITRSALYNIGVAAGPVPVSVGDVVTITYSAAPTAVFFPG
jgi:trimeric autotransporter adhesin